MNNIIGWARLGKLDHPQPSGYLPHTIIHRMIGKIYY